PLLDASGRVFAVLVGQPRDTRGWAMVNSEVQREFDEARASCDFKPASHRRGEYPLLNMGISYGGGQTRASNLSQPGKHRQATERLLANHSVQRLAGFQSAALKLFAPRLHQYYAEMLRTLCNHDPDLRPNFERSVFAAASANLGPRVVTYAHTDHLNLPSGWCAITAIGDFNPKQGGHLLLWDLNIMIEFPPGALILIPSAILRHSNTSIGEDERRYSFTQYSAGGLFRWVECGCRTQKQFTGEGGAYSITGQERWLRGVGMWSTMEELNTTA
ncbi:hypothetical protein C8Q77DRAFT_1068206, partial [Trametes polyzona]